MIGSILEGVRNVIDDDIKSRLTSPPENRIISLGNVSQLESLDNLDGQIIMSLVNLEQDVPLRNNPAFSRITDTEVRPHHPKIILNLYVLFALHQADATDTSGLDMLTRLIASLQRKNIFTSADIDISISPENNLLQTEKIIFDLYSMSFEQLNHLWGILGGKYLPSVMYKVRLIIVFVQEDTATGVIRSMEREENVIQP